MPYYNLKHDEAIILKTESGKYHGVEKGFFTKELLLTSNNIVAVNIQENGVFKKTETVDIKAFPVSMIKTFNGSAQAMVVENEFNIFLDVYFNNGQERFSFGGGDVEDKNSVKETYLWANSINHLITGAPLDMLVPQKKKKFQTKDLAGAVAEGGMLGKEMGKTFIGAIPLPGAKFLGNTAGGLIGGVVGGMVGGAAKGVSAIKSSMSVSKVEKAEKLLAETNKAEPIRRLAGKCVSCGAPISGYSGQTAHCQYCDTDQQLQSEVNN